MSFCIYSTSCIQMFPMRRESWQSTCVLCNLYNREQEWWQSLGKYLSFAKALVSEVVLLCKLYCQGSTVGLRCMCFKLSSYEMLIHFSRSLLWLHHILRHSNFVLSSKTIKKPSNFTTLHFLIICQNSVREISKTCLRISIIFDVWHTFQKLHTALLKPT